jgi:hypothetical protein
LLLTGGCHSFFPDGALPFSSSPEEELALSPDNSCIAELRGEYGKPRQVTVPVTAQTRVQDIVEATRVHSRFRKMKVMILRPEPDAPGQLVKLVCNYDPAERQITWDTDYGVQPGDRILFRQDTSTVVDDLVEGILGPVLVGRRR